MFEPIELVEKLAALVPPPRFHMVRYHGVLAPRARGRDRITPSTGRIPTTGRPPASPARPVPAPPALPDRPPPRSPHAPDQGDRTGRQSHRASLTAAQRQADTSTGQAAARARKRLTWPELMQRVFAIDVLRCPECGATMRIIAEIHPPDTTRAILDCLGLPARAPPLAPPVTPPQLESPV